MAARSKTTGAQRNSEAAPALAAQRLVLRWTEKGGPLVKPPTRQGFGTMLLQRALPTEAGVSVAVEFNPDGLVLRDRGDAPTCRESRRRSVVMRDGGLAQQES